MLIDESIASLPRTASTTIKRLNSLGIHTFFDLLNIFPNRYEDYSKFITISQLKSFQLVSLFEGDMSRDKVTLRGTIAAFKNNYTRRGFQIQKAVLEDSTGTIELVWFNQRFLSSIIRVGVVVQVSGTIKEDRPTSFNPEEYEVLPFETTRGIHTGKIVPIYPVRKNVSSRTIRDKIMEILSRNDFSIPETMPEKLLSQNNLISTTDAYRLIHSPPSQNDWHKARQRLSFDELFVMQLSSAMVRKRWKHEVTSYKLRVTSYEKQINEFTQNLPFELTSAQKKCVDQILLDLEKEAPMNRLLQGDVGSGKTVVAAVACLVSYLNGYKTLFMAPTEILAKQHFQTLDTLFNKNHLLNVALVTSSNKTKKEDLEKASVIVGTHALIAKKTHFDHIGLVVIDEQHKFGVAQRASLKEKGLNPHLLSMTATPIPRTVYLTLFGELSRSVIDEMPRGRKITKTYLVPPEKRMASYGWITKNISEEGAQVFIVCPLIEESEVETLKTIKAAHAEFEHLKKIFPHFRLGLLHGKMKSAEKEEVMRQFAKGELHILVSTPVVEVGVDIPNATIIIIEAAERFGLASLHQLRGRVGRSDKQSYCLVFTEKTDFPLINRLKTFAKISSGFELAEYDLKLRGVGEMYGTKQHGMIDLKIASLSDFELVETVHNAVSEFMKSYYLKDFPALEEKINAYQTKLIARD